MLLSTLLLKTVNAAAADTNRVLLQNAAAPDTWMPLAGLGMGNIGTYGKNAFAAVNVTRTWLEQGGRRTDSADSYGDEPGIGVAMREWMIQTGGKRQQLFIGSKIGPGGLAFPLGFNEAQQQARGIVANYSCGGYIDLLLVHWPTNYGPCKYRGPGRGGSIPTSDPLCDLNSTSYSEVGCRVSTWRGLVATWKAGIVRAIGVSNWNSTNMQDLLDAGLPLPAVNQIQWSPGIETRVFRPYGMGDSTETFGELRDWCTAHGVLVNGYSPFNGPHGARKLFADPVVRAISSRHNVSGAQAVLRWMIQKDIAVNPMATNPVYQAEDLDIFSFNLNETEVAALDSWKPLTTPPYDAQRPIMHMTPPQGWMNDPSKPIEDLRPSALHRYHLFFQWTPNSTKASWQGGYGPFWGHAVSESIAGPWTTLGAINIGKQGTGGSVQLNATHFALTWPGGVAITDDPALHVWTVMSQQHQPAPGFGFDSGNNNAVWLSNHTLTMAVSGAVGTVGDRHTDPALLRYTQPLNAVNNGSQWQFAGTIWVGRGLRRGRAECGDYFELGGRKVIMYSWRGYQVAWMVGDENENGTFVSTNEGVVDYAGYGYYASASFALSDKRRIVFAWVLEGRGYPYNGSVWAGVQALPREVTLDNSTLRFSPARELKAWRMGTQAWKQVSVDNTTMALPELTAVGIALELNLTMTIATCSHGDGAARGEGMGDSAGDGIMDSKTSGAGDALCRCGVRVRVGNQGSEWTFVGINLLSDEVVVDRSHSSTARVARQTVAMPSDAPARSRSYTLRVFVDHSVVTVFSTSGKVLTTRVYPSPESTSVLLESTGTKSVFHVSAWGLSQPISKE